LGLDVGVNLRICKGLGKYIRFHAKVIRIKKK
jgi:hypothetical protein